MDTQRGSALSGEEAITPESTCTASPSPHPTNTRTHTPTGIALYFSYSADAAAAKSTLQLPILCLHCGFSGEDRGECVRGKKGFCYIVSATTLL